MSDFATPASFLAAGATAGLHGQSHSLLVPGTAVDLPKPDDWYAKLSTKLTKAELLAAADRLVAREPYLLEPEGSFPDLRSGAEYSESGSGCGIVDFTDEDMELPIDFV